MSGTAILLLIVAVFLIAYGVNDYLVKRRKVVASRNTNTETISVTKSNISSLKKLIKEDEFLNRIEEEVILDYIEDKNFVQLKKYLSNKVKTKPNFQKYYDMMPSIF